MQTQLTRSDLSSLDALDIVEDLFSTATQPGDCPEPVEILLEDLEIPSLYVADPAQVYSTEFTTA